MKCPYCWQPDTKVIDSDLQRTEAPFEEDVPAIYVGSVLQLMKR